MTTRKKLVLVAGLASLVCAAAFISMAPSHSESLPSAVTGIEWQCARVAGILRTCSKVRVRHVEPVLQNSHKYPLCLRQA